VRVLFVTSEVYPLAKTGGLADVSSALPHALALQGIDVRILLPGYPSALAGLKSPQIEARLDSLLGVTDATLISGYLPDTGVPVWLIDAPSLFRRCGGLYQNGHGQDWSDNALRFAFFAHAAAKVAGGMMGWKPDVVHANDWHAGLLPLLLSMEKAPRPATVFTIHNLAFQGNFPREVLTNIGIQDNCFDADGMEFYGQASFLKAAIRYSDKVTTVSPTYAKEVLTPEFGCGMDGVLRSRGEDFSGILNGIDDDLWSPATDLHLPHTYSARDISGKRICKAALQRQLGLEVSPATPLIGFVSRLAHQKMADVVMEAVPAILERGAQFVLVGEGDAAIESGFEALGRKYGSSIAIRIGYEEARAHQLQAGADILLAPARFEPCGLTQLYASRYGTIPVVRKTGGLADTVTDAVTSDRTPTGFLFEDPDLPSLLGAIDRALTLYREPLSWRRMQLHAMARDFSWSKSAEKYTALYQEVSGVPNCATWEPAVSTTSSPEVERQVMR